MEVQHRATPLNAEYYVRIGRVPPRYSLPALIFKKLAEVEKTPMLNHQLASWAELTVTSLR